VASPSNTVGVMRIRHFSFSRIGGAGLVAEKLAKTQRSMGHDADLLVATNSNLETQPLKQPLVTLAAVVDNIIIKKPNEPHQLSIVRSNFSSSVNRLMDSTYPIDVAHLHWVEGFLNQQTLANFVQRGIKVVWTLHDMAPFTGGCHSNNGCEAHASGCHRCPLVRGSFENMVEQNLLSKLLSESTLSSLSLVAPSEWIASQARKSRIFSGQDVRVIANPIDPIFFETRHNEESRSRLNISNQAFVVCLVARNLDDPLKGVRSLTKVISALKAGLKQETVFIFVGKASQKLRNEFSSVRFPGPQAGEDLANYLAASDVLISASTAESAGQTVQEAAALGTPSVVISNPGLLSTIIENTTAIAVSDENEMVNVLVELSNNQTRLAELGSNARKLAKQRHNPQEVAKKYLDLYTSWN
jgi:glycosyltransferase involved in cell wall biosynthesis